jgi:3-oxoacyl-[acyl-carrier protein] reductase
MTLPLAGRTALITGVSRRAGIGFAVARRLLHDGCRVVVHHYTPHDAQQPWGADDMSVLLAALSDHGALSGDISADLAEPDAPAQVMAAAVAALEHVDILVCNHARSAPDGPLLEMTPEVLDGHWAVDTRSTMLLVREHAIQHDGRTGGRVVLMTSGQDLGPMSGEVAYAAAKGALSAVTATLAHELAPLGILLNTINPGPVDTGYASAAEVAAVAQQFPTERWGQPDDPARLVAWLVSDQGRWVVGQVLHTEGGFRRS